MPFNGKHPYEDYPDRCRVIFNDDNPYRIPAGIKGRAHHIFRGGGFRITFAHPRTNIPVGITIPVSQIRDVVRRGVK